MISKMENKQEKAQKLTTPTNNTLIKSKDKEGQENVTDPEEVTYE